MKGALIVTISCALFAGIFSYETVNSAGFRYFLENALQGYDAWLETVEDADPGPILIEYPTQDTPVSKYLFWIYYKITDQQMLGHVTQSQKNRTKQVFVDLIEKKVSVVTTTVGNIVIQGNYTAHGRISVEKDIPFNSSGTWSVTCTSIRDTYNHTFDVDNQGNIKYNYGAYYIPNNFTTELEIDESKTHFSGLWDQDGDYLRYKQEFQQQMSSEIKARYLKIWEKEWDKHPTGRLLHKFLSDEIFANEPKLTDVIKTEKPETSQPSSKLADDSEKRIRPVSEANSKNSPGAAYLREFLEKSLNNYDAWLSTAKDADPTPLNPVGNNAAIKIDEYLFKIEYGLKTEQMHGFVRNSKERRIQSVSVDMTALTFQIEVVTVGEIVFTGVYATSGGWAYVGPPILLNGIGTWNVTCKSVTDVYELKFRVTREGYLLVDLNGMKPKIKSYLETDDDKTYFGALWDFDERVEVYAPEFKQKMSAEVRNRYENWNEDWKTHPSGNLLHRFLNQTITGAPKLTEILQGKLDEGTSTTTGPTVSTTPVPGTLVPETTTEGVTSSDQAGGSQIIKASFSVVIIAFVFIFRDMYSIMLLVQ